MAVQSSANNSADLSKQLSILTSSIQQLAAAVGADSLGSNRAGASSHTRAGAAPQRTASGKLPQFDIKGANKDLKAFQNTLDDVEKKLNKANVAQDDYTKILKKAYGAQNSLFTAMAGHEKLIGSTLDNFESALQKSIKKQSMFGESIEKQVKTLRDFEKVLEETGEYLADYNDALKESGEQQLSNIQDSEKLRQIMMKLGSSMKMSKEIRELIDKRDYAGAAAKLDSEAKNASTIRKSVLNVKGEFDDMAKTTAALKSGISTVADAIGIKFLAQIATLGGSVGLIWSGVKQAYTQFWNTASAGFGSVFMGMSRNAIMLGVSLETLTKIAKDNKNQIAQMGFDNFNKSLKQTQSQLMQLGLTTEEAAKTRAALNDLAQVAGVNVRDGASLSNSVQSQIEQFHTLSAITGQSIEELAAQTKGILQSADSQKLMLGMSRQQRAAMLDNINGQRTQLVTMGLSNAAALKAIDTFNSLNSAKTTDRVEQAYKAQAGMSVLGMGDEGAELKDLLLKGKSQTNDDKKRITEIMGMAAKAKGDLDSDPTNLSKGIQGDAAFDLIGQKLTDMGTDKANSENNKLSPAEVANAKELQKVSSGVADTSAKIETFKQMVQSPLFAIAAGVIGIATLLATKLGKGMFGSVKQLVTGKKTNMVGMDELASKVGDSVEEGFNAKKSIKAGSVQEQHGLMKCIIENNKPIPVYIVNANDVGGKNGIKNNFEKHTTSEGKIEGLQKARKEATLGQTVVGREKINGTSIGSDKLKSVLARNSDSIAARKQDIAYQDALRNGSRFNRPQLPPPTPIPLTAKQRIGSALVQAKDSVIDSTKSVGSAIKGTAIKGYDTAKAGVIKAKDFAVDSTVKVATKVGDTAKAGYGAVKTVVTNPGATAGKAANAIMDGVGKAANASKTALSNAASSLSDYGKGAIEAVKNPISTMKGGFGAIGRGMGKVAGLAMKAVPFIGLAITAFDAYQGAMDGVSHAAEWFGVDTTKTALTSSQKISAGIAGALETLSFGLIPGPETARFFDDVATKGPGVITDIIQDGMETVFNKIIPALWSGMKWMWGTIFDGIVDLLSPSTWINLFSGEGGNGGIVSTVLGAVWEGVQFIALAMAKGILKIGFDIVDMLKQKWASVKGFFGFGDGKVEKDDDATASLKGFASSDTSIRDVSNDASNAKRDERVKAKNVRDAKSKGTAVGPNGETAKVVATDYSAENQIGYKTQFGQALTADDLAAQGVKPVSASAVTNTPSVNNPATGQPAQKNADGSTKTPDQKKADKTPSEELLSGILDKMTILVDLTDKGLKISMNDSTVAKTLGTPGVGQASSKNKSTAGWQPSYSDFLNNPI